MIGICGNTLCPRFDVPVTVAEGERGRCHICQRLLADGETQATHDQMTAHVLAATLVGDHPELD